ncbi:GATA zinc finger domain-containing protein 8-like [Culicoides brevitarsis]|uniref:GATA zinc finger domain-containing protein 8-like n=1 Tax=Culicoides brevitarsis TaxID=469753 RepID=UPI00307C2FDC
MFAPASASTPTSVKNRRPSNSDPIVNSLMQELHSMKLINGIDTCESKSGDSGFLSSGDSSVNGDAYSNNASVVLRANNPSHSSGNAWDQKTIWDLANSFNNSAISNDNNFGINSTKDSIWSMQSSPVTSNNVWENTLNKQSINTNISMNTANKNLDAEWLGSIWMIPQTTQRNTTNSNNETLNNYSSKLNAIWDTSESNKQLKADVEKKQAVSVNEFQLLRPHDIGRNMWNNSTAASVMNNISKEESMSSIWAAPSTTTTFAKEYTTVMQQNLLSTNTPKYYPVVSKAIQHQQNHINHTDNNKINASNHQSAATII